ncbi:unnamed protein product [Blepharisma stoltei]|uniref:EF-hand domain-containing protein n=1 Tax=Blepharisma stoltei TaxID=1481888 RepID=A0AAU9KAQ2_9CILI|nr:unnamed protein product [Blepharisma stoltei]
MGCASSREKLSVEEIAIIQMEEQLEFFKNTVRDVDMCFKKNSDLEHASPAQWESISIILGIKIKNTYQCPKAETLYQHYTLEDGRIIVRPLLILGIMLSSGTARRKARLIFELYDRNNTKVLPKSEIHEIIRLILDLSLIRLPELVSNKTRPCASEARIKAYVQSILTCREAAEQGMFEKFMGLENLANETIDKDEFIKHFADEETARLTAPYAVRLFALRYNELNSNRDKN